MDCHLAWFKITTVVTRGATFWTTACGPSTRLCSATTLTRRCWSRRRGWPPRVPTPWSCATPMSSSAAPSNLPLHATHHPHPSRSCVHWPAAAAPVARLPCCRNHCATWVMSESASNDLELLVLEVHDFPFDVTAASDLVATVGSMPATVETAEYYEAGADAESSNQHVNVNIPSDDSSCRSGRR